MKNKAYTSRVTKRILSALVLVILPLLAVNQAQAKRSGVTRGKPMVAVVSPSDLSGIDIRNSVKLKARLLELMARNPKAVKMVPLNNVCSVVAPESLLGGFGSCFKGCVKDAGVSAVQLIMCGAACAVAGTGVGAIACAICVGVSVTVIQTCAVGCAIYGRAEEIGMEEGLARNTRQPRAPARSLQAKLRRQ